MKNKYSTKFDVEKNARTLGRDLPISTKQAVEICNFLRKKITTKAKQHLNDVIQKKIAVPFKRFNKDMGHKPGIAAGRYPIKASQHFLELINNVEANASFKGLDTSSLLIKHICAHKAATPWHFGRLRRRKMKRTHVEIIVEEKEVKKKEPKLQPKEKQPQKPEEKKEQK